VRTNHLTVLLKRGYISAQVVSCSLSNIYAGFSGNCELLSADGQTGRERRSFHWCALCYQRRTALYASIWVLCISWRRGTIVASNNGPDFRSHFRFVMVAMARINVSVNDKPSVTENWKSSSCSVWLLDRISFLSNARHIAAINSACYLPLCKWLANFSTFHQ